MQQLMIGNLQVFHQQEINKNKKNSLQEFSQQEWTRYRCTEQIDHTTMMS